MSNKMLDKRTHFNFNFLPQTALYGRGFFKRADTGFLIQSEKVFLLAHSHVAVLENLVAVVVDIVSYSTALKSERTVTRMVCPPLMMRGRKEERVREGALKVA